MKFTIYNVSAITHRLNRLGLALACLIGVMIVAAAPALAQGAVPEPGNDFAGLLPAALLLLLPVGLILLISSALPEERAPATAVHLLVVWALAGLAYFGAGFAFHFGGIAQVVPDPDLRALYWEWYPLDQSVDVSIARLWGVIALNGWALAGEAATPGVLRLFLHHLPLVGVAAIIPGSVLLQRGRGGAALLVGLLAGLVIYPLPGNWAWGGGWLAHLGANLGLGHGLVDFGGAGVVFLAGSLAALVALVVFRPGVSTAGQRPAVTEVVVGGELSQTLTVYDDSSGEPPEIVLPAIPMPSAYLPLLGLLGAGLMLLGWLGLSAGQHTPTAINYSPATAAVNGLLAALASALAAAGYSWVTTRELNALMTSRGLVAGLVLAMAGAPFMPTWLMLLAGLAMGLLLPPLVYLFHQGLSLADELGATATYGLSGLAGLLLVALFADGRAGQGWNGIGLADYAGVAGQGISGLVVAPGFAGDWPGQFQAQLLGVGAIILWAAWTSFLLYQSVLAVTNAWARTGLELVEPTLPARPALADEITYRLPGEAADADGQEDSAPA